MAMVATANGPVAIDHVHIEVRRALRQKLEYIADNLQIHIENSLNEKIQALMNEIERLRALNGNLLGKSNKLEKRNQKLEKALSLQAEYRRLVEEILNSQRDGQQKQKPAQLPPPEIERLIFLVVQKLMKQEGLLFVEDQEVCELVQRLQSVDPRMCEILVMRYENEETYKAIGKKFQISAARVRQIADRACRILRYKLKENEQQLDPERPVVA